MRILLGMSGGLDSTYAAHKLITEGHTVEGAVLIMHGCTEISAAEDSAASLDIPLHKIDCKAAFESAVISDFISEYLAGRTPNPCVVCNSEVKFAVLLEYARSHGFDAIATGHYAKITKRELPSGVRYTVSRARDGKKDQSYMLWRLSQDVLSHLLLPLADDNKCSIREVSRDIGLTAADREESQEICFIPSGDYALFIEERTKPSTPGYFINNEGKILGEHKGIIHYTVGQRKGLGIALGERVFVTKIDPVANTVTLSAEGSASDLFSVCDMRFLGISEPSAGEVLRLSVKIRYLAPPVKCTLKYLGAGVGEVSLDTPAKALTPGQSAVFYDGDDVVCGGRIAVEG